MNTVKDIAGTAILNDRDCPLLTSMNYIRGIAPSSVVSAVSIVHECTTDCKYTNCKATIIERETVTISNGLNLVHDYSNNFFCLNVYCMKCIYR